MTVPLDEIPFRMEFFAFGVEIFLAGGVLFCGVARVLQVASLPNSLRGLNDVFTVGDLGTDLGVLGVGVR